VVGYVGSGDCLAVAPVAEELKKFLILYDCGTPRIFEDNTFRYVFRTAAHATMDNVSMARYLKARNIPVKTYNLINQDYAWGQDSRKDFMLSMANLYPEAKAGVDQLPKFGAGQYGTEISALMSQPADLVHTSLWGGDLQAFVLQAGPRGTGRQPGQKVVLHAAVHHRQRNAVLARQHAHRCATGQKVFHHLPAHVARKGRNTACSQAMVAGKHHHLRRQQLGRGGPKNLAQLKR